MTPHADRSSFFVALVVVDVLAGLADAMSGPVHRAFSRRSGALEPAFAQRHPDRKGARRNRVRHRIGRLGRPEDERRAAAPGARRVRDRLRLSRLHHQFRASARHRGVPDRHRGGRLFPVGRARQAALRACKLPHRQPRSRRPARQLVARMGDRTGARRRGGRGVRISRRVFHERRLRPCRAGDARPGAGENRSPATQATGIRPKPQNGGPAIALAFTGLALFHTAMFLGSIPLAIVHDHLARRGEQRRRMGLQPVRRARNRGDGRDHLAAAQARRAAGDRGRLRGFRAPILSRSRWRSRSPRCSGPRFCARSASGL